MVIFGGAANHLGSILWRVDVAFDELEKSCSHFYAIVSGNEFLLWRVSDDGNDTSALFILPARNEPRHIV